MNSNVWCFTWFTSASTFSNRLIFTVHVGVWTDTVVKVDSLGSNIMGRSLGSCCSTGDMSGIIGIDLCLVNTGRANGMGKFSTVLISGSSIRTSTPTSIH